MLFMVGVAAAVGLAYLTGLTVRSFAAGRTVAAAADVAAGLATASAVWAAVTGGVAPAPARQLAPQPHRPGGCRGFPFGLHHPPRRRLTFTERDAKVTPTTGGRRRCRPPAVEL